MNDASDRLDSALDQHRKGDLKTAARLYESILREQPHHADALHLLAVVHIQTGEPTRAIPLMQKALAIRPDTPTFLNTLGNAAAAMGDTVQAITAYRRALALQPSYAEGHVNLGVALMTLGDRTAAEASLRRAVGLVPTFADAWINLSELLRGDGRLAEARDAAWHAVAARPHSVPARLALAAVDRMERRHDSAEAHLRQALAIDSSNPTVHLVLAQVLLRRGRFSEAEHAARRAAEAMPEEAHVLDVYGNCLAALDRFADARACFDQALARDPDNAGIRWNRGLTRLASGDVPAGWLDFEARLQRPEHTRRWTGTTMRRWRGEPIAKSTVFLHAEQGLGDTLQFCRFIPKVAEAGARVVVEVPSVLAGLIARMPGVDRVVVAGKERPSDVEWHCPIMSLPAVFGIGLDTVVPAMPYLTTDPTRSRQWRSRLEQETKEAVPRVGLVWAGNPRMGDDALRSPRLPALTPVLSVPGLSFIGLQVGDGRADLDQVSLPNGFLDLGGDLADFDDTAAVLETIDLLITSCTASAHLAGALGRPVWILLSAAPDWRWLRGRTDSPWYPSARLFRQRQAGDWTPVMADVADALAALVGRRPIGSSSLGSP